jgi:hypothetical protein
MTDSVEVIEIGQGSVVELAYEPVDELAGAEVISVHGELLPGVGQGHTHRQLSADNPWVIDHNLGFAPGGITLLDSDGSEIEGDPSYPLPTSRVVITFPYGITVSGVAYLS